jgi:hypothetical protein
MPSSDRPEQTIDDGVVINARPACVALVPTAQPAPQWSQAPGHRPLSRPNSIFITHLIATAQRAPQTRTLRRASAADAQTAYRASQQPLQRAGIRTRQVI